ncbi:putative nectin-2-like [Triplophysa rosa]|uniref:Nectin-2-like n=1 Tax=Triplophysa rosa TaxID=992332 RepID=A0A9W7WG29_TRIRA|nr:putative nectin-2-like [Triplophysa rosa]
MYQKRRRGIENGEGPPKHKPPPPMNSGSSTEMLNKPQDKATTITETQPLRKHEPNYYETTSAEPVTDLDDDNTGPPANGGTPTVWDSSGHLPEKEDSADEPLPPYAPIDRNDMEASQARAHTSHNEPGSARDLRLFLNVVASLSTCHPASVRPVFNESDLKASPLMRYKLSVAIVSCHSRLSQLWAAGVRLGP